MATDRELASAARRQDRHSTKRAHATRKRFCGVDGEGGDIDGRHEYQLLRAGTHLLQTGKPLGTAECLAFLADLPKDVLYVSFFFDYDVTMMLRGLPFDRLTRLLDQDCRRLPDRPCSTLPVDVGPFQVDYLPRKEFRVRRFHKWDTVDGKRIKKYHPWTVISDTGSFFQTSFVKALRAWFGHANKEDWVCDVCGGGIHDWIPDIPTDGDKIDRIAEGKEQREGFTQLDSYQEKYNRLEIEMLERLMEKFRIMSDKNNIRPMKWQGPGNLVSAVMRREKLPNRSTLDPLYDAMPGLLEMANDGYYGGRFELGVYGDIAGPVYQYDINSAYADTYRLLPCLIHGRWERITDRPTDGSLYVGEASFKHPDTYAYCTLPVRGKSDGALLFPRQASGTYWSPELEMAAEHARIWFKQGYRYIQACDCTLFDWVYEIYDARKAMGKDVQGKVLKLVLASIYGKLAQSVGCAPYSNPIWASLIVSNVRATLARAALQVEGGSDVLMLATDGLFSTQPRSLPIGGKLGEWTETVHPSMFAVQSGVYFIPGQSPKTRGVPQTQVIKHEQQFRDVWDHFLRTGELGSVDVPLHSFTGLRLAMARHKQDTAGTWNDITKSVAFDWTTKRVFSGVDNRTVVTEPMAGGRGLKSEPYSRIIGGLKAQERLMLADQPEWGQQFA